MPTNVRHRRRHSASLALLATALCHALLAPPLRAEDFFDWTRQGVLPRDLSLDGSAAGATAPKGHRIQLFRIQPGFLTDPLGVMPDDTPQPETGTLPETAGPDWINVTAGTDNPYFDFRLPGDPGGVGYYKLWTQVQLFESLRTGCALGLQAVTPAGLESDGLANGPTVVSPAVSVYHALEDGTAFQGFIGKNLRANPGWSSQLHHSINYGMAVQRPVLPAGPDGGSNLYLFLGALGRYRYDGDNSASLTTWDLLPGMHLRLNENWWVTSGLILPVGPVRTENRLWQITCSFRF
jgi:hypothetical protein